LAWNVQSIWNRWGTPLLGPGNRTNGQYFEILQVLPSSGTVASITKMAVCMDTQLERLPENILFSTREL
jgi:hypothetical protein